MVILDNLVMGQLWATLVRKHVIQQGTQIFGPLLTTGGGSFEYYCPQCEYFGEQIGS